MWRGREDRIEQNDSSESCTPAVCIMYNACTRVCNKQQGGVVRSPTGSPWSSAPRQANTVVSNIDFLCAYFWDPAIPVASAFCFPVSIIISRWTHRSIYPFKEIRSRGPWVRFEAFKCLKLGFTQPFHEYKFFFESLAWGAGRALKWKWKTAISVFLRLSAWPCLFYIKLPGRAL